MDKLSSLSNANKTYINNLKNNSNNKQYSQNPNLELKPDSVELSTKKESPKKSKLALAIGVITASVATVLGCVYALKKTGKTDKLDDIAKNAFKLADVDFNDGIAKLKDGSNFTGVIDDVLKNGDKIKLEYTDGIIKKSTREGQKSFKKVYETINDEKIVTEIKDNVVDKINITTIQNSAKTQQEKLKNLLSNNSDLSIEDFKKQTDEIQFKSKEQKDKIDEIIKNKKEAEIKAQKAKEEAEAKLKAEAEAKAQEEAKYKPIDILKSGENIAFKYGISLEELAQEPGLDEVQKKTLSEAKDLTLDSSINLFTDFRKAEIFNVPEKMAIAADNSLRQKGSAFICESTPKLFDGIEQDKIQQSITNFLDNVDFKKYSSFTIDDKKFKAEKIGGGAIGTVYKIFDDTGNSVVVKKYGDPLLMGANSGFQEIATARQATKENVVDIPKFFMANAVGYTSNSIDKYKYKSQPMWMMSEFIPDNAKIQSKGKKLTDWMNQYGLYHYDLNSGTKKGDYIVDLGGIMPDINSASVQNRENWGHYFENALGKSLAFDGIQSALKKLDL